MIKRMWKNHMRDRETIRAGVWIIGMQDRVSTLVEFTLVWMSVFRERQTDWETVWIIDMTDRVPSLYNDQWWHSFRSQVPGLIHTRSCIVSTPNRVSSLDVYPVSPMNKYSCMTLTDPWHLCMTHRDQSFVFECQVFQTSQVCPVFQSRSLCEDLYIHRLPPLVSPSPPKTKKQFFLQVCTQFSIVLMDV
jgi:hypothetical protein